MTGRRSITEVDPQDAVLANAAANADPAVPEVTAVLDDVQPDAPVEGWTLPDGQSNLIGKHVTLVDDTSGLVIGSGVGPTGLGMIELQDGGVQHASNVVAVRDLTAKEAKAAAKVQA